jgi:hypothetical protein
MNNFKKNIYRSCEVPVTGICVSLTFFDYKGVGAITFNFTLCNGTPSSFTTSALPNSGGNFVTWDMSSEDPMMPCYIDGTLTASIVNCNNFVTAPCGG